MHPSIVICDYRHATKITKRSGFIMNKIWHEWADFCNSYEKNIF